MVIQHISRNLFRRQAEYPNWAKVLAFGDKPVNLKSNRKVDEHWTFSSWYESVPDTPEQSLISTEIDRFVALVSNTGSTDILQQNVSEKYGWSPDVRRWLAGIMLSEENPLASGLAADRFSAATDWAIDQMPEPWRAQYS